MSRQLYNTPHSLIELRESLSANDWSVLQDVSVMRLAAVDDLQSLQDLRSPISVRQFRRVLAELHEREVLFRLERTIGGKRRGSAGFVYGVGLAGQRLRAVGGEDQNIRRPWTPRPSWLNHALAASHLYVVLRQLEASLQLKVQTFDTEPGCWRPFRDADGEITLKPDAALTVAQGDYLDSYFVEVDLATESPATIARKCDVYRRYWLGGAEQQAQGVFPRVLWLAPTNERVAVLEKVIDHLGEASELHRAARYDEFSTVVLEEPP